MSAHQFQATVAFLTRIGIVTQRVPGASGFLSHLRIDAGQILYDREDDDLVGDLLHEAGHVAVVPSMFRPHIQDDVGSILEMMGDYFEAHTNCIGIAEDPVARGILQSGEVEAIAWSYAAAVAADIDTMAPFRRGFGGEGWDVHNMLQANSHLGINRLFHAGMGGPPRRGAPNSYPRMVRWLQV